MFRCHMLVTNDLRPMAKGITIKANWGTLTLVIDGDPRKTVTGKHMFVEGDIDAFEGWFAGSSVWMGVGHPQEQKFELTPFSK